MVWAYIRYLEGAAKGNHAMVATSDFKNKFKNLQFDEKKKYFVKEKESNSYLKCRVLFLESTVEKIKKKINDVKRPRVCPNYLMETASEESSNDIRKVKNNLKLKSVKVEETKLTKN